MLGSVCSTRRCSNTAGRGVSISGERMPKQKRRRRREKEGGEKRGRKGHEEARNEGQVSISLYLPGKNERTKQMNRREEGMITTKMIIFNQNHDNNNK